MIHKKILYIASPYTNQDKDVVEMNFHEVSKIVADLVKEDYVAISPVTYGHVLGNYSKLPEDVEFWNTFCLNILLRCDILVICDTMNDWKLSKGISVEIDFALKNNIRILYLSNKESWDI